MADKGKRVLYDFTPTINPYDTADSAVSVQAHMAATTAAPLCLQILLRPFCWCYWSYYWQAGPVSVFDGNL
jgi:hypothetical protein